MGRQAHAVDLLDTAIFATSILAVNDAYQHFADLLAITASQASPVPAASGANPNV